MIQIYGAILVKDLLVFIDMRIDYHSYELKKEAEDKKNDGSLSYHSGAIEELNALLVLMGKM